MALRNIIEPKKKGAIGGKCPISGACTQEEEGLGEVESIGRKEYVELILFPIPLRSSRT